MRDFLKNNKYSLVLGVFTFILGGIAIGTALRLYQLRTTAPTDSGATAQNTIEACQVLTIPLSPPEESPSASASATATATATATASPSISPSATATATATATANPQACDVSCNTDADCREIDSNYVCYSATRTCRHINYPQQDNCEAPPTSTASPTAEPTDSSTTAPSTVSQATATPQPTQAELPEAGFGLPTILSIGAAGILLIGALILAL